MNKQSLPVNERSLPVDFMSASGRLKSLPVNNRSLPVDFSHFRSILRHFRPIVFFQSICSRIPLLLIDFSNFRTIFGLIDICFGSIPVTYDGFPPWT